MKYILTPNLEPPFNLRRRQPNYRWLNLYASEQEYLETAVTRERDVGLIPFPTEAERQARIVELALAGFAPSMMPDFPPPGGPHWVVDETELPSGVVSEENDYFFDCWEWNNGCKVNMPKARDLHMDQIRSVRNTELAKLDAPFMQALEARDVAEQQRIADLKQQLRDIPQTFDLNVFTTPESLKSSWPLELPPKV